MAKKEECGFKVIISLPELLSAIGLIPSDKDSDKQPDEKTEDSEAEWKAMLTEAEKGIILFSASFLL